MKQLMELYLHALKGSDYPAIISLFTEDATVDSPLYGRMTASDFYRELMKDTGSSTIALLHLFIEGSVGAAHFRYDWKFADGPLTTFQCVDVFEFENGKIKHITIIYDTWHTR